MDHRPACREVDAIDLLRRDHHAIKRLFVDHQRAIRRGGDPEIRAEIVGRICFRWCLHLQIEDEIFYPAARLALGTDALIGHALMDHTGSRELVARLDEMEIGDTDHDATVAVLCAYIVLHMDEEELAIFPRLRDSGLDTLALGRLMAQRQRTLHRDITRIGLSSPMRGGMNWPTVFCAEHASDAFALG